MKKFLARIVGYLYYKITGIRAHNTFVKYEDASGALKAISRLAEKYNKEVTVSTWDREFPSESQDAKELADLFKKYGSDKSTRHNYHLIYANALKDKRNNEFNLLEIGLGKPSASVSGYCASSKAFRDWAPKAQIYGADILKDLLFQEERIKTYYVDQTKPEELEKLVEQLPNSFDLIIDDGLHSPWANFNTIEAMLPLLSDSGILVVEDILERYEHFWPTLVATLSSSYDCKLVKMKYSLVCIIQKKK